MREQYFVDLYDSLDELTDEYIEDHYITVARIIDEEKGQCVELHLNDNVAEVEIGTRINEDCWENETVEADWFFPEMGEDNMFDKLDKIFDENF